MQALRRISFDFNRKIRADLHAAEAEYKNEPKALMNGQLELKDLGRWP